MRARWKSFPWLNVALESSGVLRFWLGRDEAVRVFSRDAWLVLAITVVWFAIAYALNDSPSWNSGGSPGWLVWWDQGQYHKAAAELAHGELRPNTYWIGYPAIGAVFYNLLPRHPFFVPDLAMVLAIVAAYYAAARLYLTRIEAVVLVYLFIWFDPCLRDDCLVVPWNTMPAYTAFFVAIYLLVLRPGPAWPGHFALCSGLAAVAGLARPTEMAALGLVYLFALGRLANLRQRVVAAAWFVAVLIGVATTLVALNEYFYHGVQSPYIAGESGKIQASRYGVKAWQFFADSVFLTGDGAIPAGTRPPSLFSRYPEFLFVLPGLFFLLRERGWAAAGAMLGVAFTLGFYLLYVPFDNPPYAWTYGQWHYVAWIFPWLGLATYLTFRRAFQALPRRVFIATLALPLVITVAVGFAAVPVAWATPEAGDGLRLETQTEAGAYTITLHVLENCRVEDVRLVFHRPPPFYGTDVSSLQWVRIAVNGVAQRDMVDCMTSQENATYHFSFLAHGLALRAGDEIEVRFKTKKAPELARAELAAIRFAPLQAWRDYLSR